MDDLDAVARMGTAQLRAALIIPRRSCRACGVELAPRPGPGRPLVLGTHPYGFPNNRTPPRLTPA